MQSSGLRSKSWDEYAAPGAPEMNFVFTVCDNAAGEVCPVWPGNPVTAHWGVPDPAAAVGDDMARKRAFWQAFRRLETRIRLFVSLPIAQQDDLSLKRKVEEIGETS
jgi:arsenate reductase